MKTSANKKGIFVFLILVFLFIPINIVYAQGFTDTLIGINNFFEDENYKAYATIIDFVLFFLIALAAMLIGVKAIFPEKRQANVIAIIFALIMTLGLIRKGVSVESLLPYIGFIVFTGLVIIVFFILMATGILKEKRLWAFLVSLIIAFIIFILLGRVFDVDGEGIWDLFIQTINELGLLEGA